MDLDDISCNWYLVHTWLVNFSRSFLGRGRHISRRCFPTHLAMPGILLLVGFYSSSEDHSQSRSHKSKSIQKGKYSFKTILISSQVKGTCQSIYSVISVVSFLQPFFEHANVYHLHTLDQCHVTEENPH